MEGKLKGMQNYEATETNKYGFFLAKFIRSVWHLQDNDKKDAVTVVETEKQAYLLYQAPYHSNIDYLEAFKSHLNIIEAHSGDIEYNLVLYEATLMNK